MFFFSPKSEAIYGGFPGFPASTWWLRWSPFHSSDMLPMSWWFSHLLGPEKESQPIFLLVHKTKTVFFLADISKSKVPGQKSKSISTYIIIRWCCYCCYYTYRYYLWTINTRIHVVTDLLYTWWLSLPKREASWCEFGQDSYLQTGDDAIAVKSGWDCFGSLGRRCKRVDSIWKIQETTRPAWLQVGLGQGSILTWRCRDCDM